MMLCTLPPSKKAAQNSVKTINDKMEPRKKYQVKGDSIDAAESPTKSRKQTKADRERIAQRQQSLEKVHVKRIRDKIAYHQRSAQIKKQLSGSSNSAGSSRVSMHNGMP
jgi:hypothetical protein